MEEYYKQKYYKYKTKYLDNLKGGVSNNIFIATMSGREIDIDINHSDTILTIKKKIAEKMDYPYWFLIGIYDDNKILFNNNMSISECYATRSNKNLEILYLNFTLYLYDNDDKKILNIIKRDIKLFFQSYRNIKTNVKEYVIFISYILDFLVSKNEIKLYEFIKKIFNDDKTLSDNKQLMLYLISKNNDMLQFASERLKNEEFFFNNIFIMTTDNTKIDINIYQYDTLLNIKKKIAEKLKYPYWFLIGIYDDNKILLNNNISISKYHANRSNKNLKYLTSTLSSYEEKDKSILDKLNYDISSFIKNYNNLTNKLRENIILISYMLDFLVNNNEINYHESIEIIFNDNKSLSDNEQLMFYLISKNNDMLYFASERLKNDKNFLIPFIKKNGYILKHVHENLKNDEDVVRLAIKNDLRVGVYANQELLKRIVELQPIKKNI